MANSRLDQVVDVAVGILMRPNGEVLLGQRPKGKPYAGYWEFPGGKVEVGESILEALKREFLEELGVTIVAAQAWCGVAYVYPHAHVHLHFYICREWLGQPQSLEGQALAWQGCLHEASQAVQPLLPATIPLLAWLDQWYADDSNPSNQSNQSNHSNLSQKTATRAATRLEQA